MIVKNFNELTRSLPETCFLVSKSGEILSMNPSGEKMLGTDSKMVAGKRIADLVADPYDKVSRYIKICLRSREPVPGALRWRLSEGRTVECRCSGNLILSDTKEDKHLVLLRCEPKEAASNKFIALDKMLEQLKASYHKLTTQSEELKNEIVERKQAEEDLRRLNEELEQRVKDRTAELKNKYEELEDEINERRRMEGSLRLVQFAVDHASDCIYWIKPDARFANVNDSTCRRLGYDRDELLNLTVFDVDPAFPREEWDAHWREIRKRRSFTIETRHRTKEGEVFPVEVTVNYVEYEGGEYNFAFARDISERKRDEEALTREREFSRALLDSMADGVVACDAEGTLTLFNRTAREWHGLDPMKLPPEEWAKHYDLFRPDGITPLPTAEIPLARAFRGEIVADAGMAIVAKGRATRYILANGSVIRDERGMKLGAVVVMRDVTELRRVEEELRKTNEELERRVIERTAEIQRRKDELDRFFNVALDLLCVADTDCFFRLLNITWEKTLGYTRDELMAKRFLDFIHPDDLPATLEALSTLASQQEVLNFVNRYRCEDGTYRWFEWRATPVGELIYAAARDITERKRIEEALEKSEQRLQLHVRQTPLAVIEWDTGFHVISWNPAAEKVFGYSAAEASGCHAEFIVPVIARPHVDRVWGDLLLRKGGERSTNENVTKDGKTILCEWYNTPLVTADGRVIGVASLVQDITERKRMEAALRTLNEELESRVKERTAALQESQFALMNIVDDLNQKTLELEDANNKLKDLDRLKSMFIASMSHELRTPLNSIIGFSSILHDGWIGPVNDEQKENLATILRSGKHLLNLINDVIDISKIEAGKIECKIEDFDLNDVISEAVNLLISEIKEKGLSLTVDAVSLRMRTDRRRLLQCVINLLSNAVKFTEKGSVRISARKEVRNLGLAVRERHQIPSNQPSTADVDFVEISVEDTGIGIKEEDLPKLFGSFVRLDSPFRTTVKGTGLGLYLARKLIIEVLKGDIICTSRYGEGSVFTIRIPVRIE